MNIDYSKFKFFKFPPEWRLQEDDEEQIKADIEGNDNHIKFLEQTIKERCDTSKNSA